MPAQVHPAATHHLPIFITPPGQTDVLMVVTAGFLLIAVVAFGLLFLRLHSLPERMAHRGHKLQFEIVAVLCLIALLTHIHAFWLAALLLALIDVPDFGGWMGRIADGVEQMARKNSAEVSTTSSVTDDHDEAKPSDRAGHAPSGEPPGQSAKDREMSHA
jgi:hypothetical protein